MPRLCKRVGVGNGIMTGSWRKVLIPTARMPRARVVTHFYEFLLVLTIYRNVLRNRLKRQYGSFHLSSGPTGSLYQVGRNQTRNPGKLPLISRRSSLSFKSLKLEHCQCNISSGGKSAHVQRVCDLRGVFFRCASCSVRI